MYILSTHKTTPKLYYFCFLNRASEAETKMSPTPASTTLVPASTARSTSKAKEEVHSNSEENAFKDTTPDTNVEEVPSDSEADAPEDKSTSENYVLASDSRFG